MSDENVTPKKGKLSFYEWSVIFLDRLSECGNVTKAARAAGITRKTAYERRATNERFAAAWADALGEAADVLEEEAWRRAVEGVEKPAGWFRGEPGGLVTEYSDTLLIFLLKAHRPDKFRDNVKVTHEGEISQNIKGYLNVSPDDWDDTTEDQADQGL